MSKDDKSLSQVFDDIVNRHAAEQQKIADRAGTRLDIGFTAHKEKYRAIARGDETHAMLSNAVMETAHKIDPETSTLKGRHTTKLLLERATDTLNPKPKDRTL